MAADSEPKKIIIDTDPGIDDAMAIFLALQSPEIQVIALTTIYGNVYTTLATRNALHLLEVAGRTDIPVVEGSHVTLTKGTKLRIADFVHGADGLGNQNFPPPKGKPLEESAAAFLVHQAKANPGKVTVVALGPLTNIALAIQLDPEFAKNIGQIILLGGAFAVNGNVNPAAEANIFGDPDAADVVFTSGADVLAVGINVTHQVVLTGVYLHDPTALLAAVDPSLETAKRIDKLLMVLILRSLHPNYDHVRDHILSSEQMRSMNSLITRLLRVPTITKGDGIAVENFVMRKKRGIRGMSRNGKGGCGKLICSHCGKGHLQNRCYDLIGWPDKTANTSSSDIPSNGMTGSQFISDEEYQEFLRLKSNNHAQSVASPSVSTACISHSMGSQVSWIIDLGASDHISGGNDSVFSSISSPKFPYFISLTNGSKM
ncbi:putative uridine nucleosidase 2, partial [Mucuna pruriens]